MLKKTFPTLFKAAAKGGVQLWDIYAEETEAGHGKIVTRYGLQGGKIQEATDIIREGKNRGRSNATTPYQQALSEAESRWNMQLSRKGYGLSAAESAAVRAVSPMLAKVYKDHKKQVSWETAFAQRKLDGFRCMVRRDEKGRVQLTSRENQPMPALIHLADLFSSLKMPMGTILDGEIYLHGQPLNLISGACKKRKELTTRLQFHAYDCLITKTDKPIPFAQRYAFVRDLVARANSEYLIGVETIKVRSEDELFQCQYRFLEDGYEGAMLRHGTVGYQAGKRSVNLLKVKVWEDAEFPVVDFKMGRGGYDGVPIFVCETEAGFHFDVTAPGNMEEKRALGAKAKYCIGRQLTVRFQKFTATNEPVPFLPVAKGFVNSPNEIAANESTR